MMTTLTPPPEERDLDAETRRVYARLYERFEASFFPDSWPTDESRERRLKIIGAAGLGIFSAGFAIFMVFLVLNMVFHYAPKTL